jgi:hypothetical protein
MTVADIKNAIHHSLLGADTIGFRTSSETCA